MSSMGHAQRHLSRREFLLLCGGSLGAWALAGLAGRSSLAQGLAPTPVPTWTPAPVPTPNGAYTGEVEIWGWLGADNHFIAARDAGRYAAMFPDLTVTPVRFSCPDAHANLLNALTSGLNVPDLVNFHASYTNSFADGLLDLGERFAPYSQHFPPRILNLATSADRVVGVPQDIEPVALAYRADIFERYGITEDDLATWEGYVEAGRKLWRDSGETIKMIAMDAPGSQMAVFGAPHQVHEVFLHLAGYHGVFFDREDRAVIIDERQALIAFETFQTITAPEVAWIFQNPTVSVEAYRAGRVATNICPAWWIVVLSTEFSDQAGLWRLMPLPALRPGFARATLQIPTLTGIPLMALNPDAAWEVLYDTQITADAQYRLWQTTGGIMPAHLEVLDYLADQEIPYFGGQKVYGLLLDVFNNLLRVQFGRGWVEARAILTRHIEPIMRGEVPVVDGVRAAAGEMRLRLNKR